MEEEVLQISPFKRYLLCLKKGWQIVLVCLITGLLFGFIMSSFTYTNKYEEISYSVLNFKYTKEITFDYKDIISDDNISRAKTITKSLETGSKVSTYQYIDIKDISITKNSNYYTIKANVNSFNVSKDLTYSDVAAKGFLKHLTLLPFITDSEIEEYNNSDLKGHDVFSNFDNEFYKENSLVDNKLIVENSRPDAHALNEANKVLYYTLWISISGTFLFIVSLVLIFIFKDKLKLNVKREYDNKKIYRTPFHLSIFIESAKSFKDIKSLCMMSLLLGFVMISKFIPIPSGFGNLGISFALIFLSVACMIYGPTAALVIGALSDIIGYLIRPDGIFFIGYTFQSMLACFTYGMCFYKTHITFSKCLIARIVVNFICNVLIGSLCWGFISNFTWDQTVVYMLTISLPKNILYLLPQSLLIFIVLKALSHPLNSLGFIEEDIANNISFF